MVDSDRSDVELVQLILRGSSETFAVLMRKYWNLVLRISYSYLKNDSDAEEAAQLVFIQVYENLQKYNLGMAFRPWLIGVTMNKLKSYYRGRKRRNDRTEEFDDYFPSGDPGPDSSVVRSEATREVREAVMRLPLNLREAVMLYYFHAMDVSEIAEALGIGNENVKSRLFRARRKLKSILQRKHNLE